MFRCGGFKEIIFGLCAGRRTDEQGSAREVVAGRWQRQKEAFWRGKAVGYLGTIDKIDTLYADTEDGFENRSCDRRHCNVVGCREAGERKEEAGSIKRERERTNKQVERKTAKEYQVKQTLPNV
jgi:hypothetical protein